jgi:protein involved in polysaccharide export with SLBB domain
MKKTILTLLIFSSSLIFAQEIDQNFLDSLPKDIQEDLLKQTADSSAVESPVYRSIQSQTKLEKKELEDLKNRLKDDLEYLESKLSEEGKIENRDDLRLFGSEFFSNYQSTYMPINEPNLSASYILDFGDTLQIQLVGGSKSFVEEFSLKRDGTISLPDIGKINLAGQSLNNAISLITAMVNSAFVGSEVYISLTNVRDINVLVSGDAYNPGIYTVSGNSTMLHVLGVAGGINEFGSYREISLIRGSKVIETLDMYDVLITGIHNSKTPLRTGDVIFVKPSLNIISLDGAVKKSAKYELLDNQNLSAAIKYANGLTIDADLNNIYLERVLDGKIKSIPISNIKQFDTLPSKDGDKVFIRKFPFRSVYIQGAVLKPGKYLISEGESIDNLLEKAGGYSENAYPFGAVYENQGALSINKKAKDLLYAKFIDNIITISQKNPSGNYGLNSILDITKSLKNTAPNGRIAINLLDADDANNMIIKDGDRLTIPERPSHIFIYGEVSNEGAIKYQANEGINYYISRSGGLKGNADSQAIYVLHPNGITQRANVKKNIFQNNPGDKLELYPGSVVFVPRGIDNTATSTIAAQAYVSILGNIGIALASLSAIND